MIHSFSCASHSFLQQLFSGPALVNRAMRSSRKESHESWPDEQVEAIQAINTKVKRPAPATMGRSLQR
jgi:hypothetical protein